MNNIVYIVWGFESHRPYETWIQKIFYSESEAEQYCHKLIDEDNGNFEYMLSKEVVI